MMHQSLHTLLEVSTSGIKLLVSSAQMFLPRALIIISVRVPQHLLSILPLSSQFRHGQRVVLLEYAVVVCVARSK
jgi:hypothetical protein